MDWIISFFEDIAQTLSGIVNFLVTMVDGLLSLIEMLPSLIADMTTAVNFLPYQLTIFFSVSVSVTVIFLIAGRGQGGE